MRATDARHSRRWPTRIFRRVIATIRAPVASRPPSASRRRATARRCGAPSRTASGRSFDVLARVGSRPHAGGKAQAALATFASMVGAIVLARAVDDAELSADILEAVRDSIDPAAV